MKKLFLATVLGLVSVSANAGWFGNNNSWNDLYDDNNWPEWTPMYWMEEMMDEWDNDDDNYYQYPMNYHPQVHSYPQAPVVSK